MNRDKTIPRTYKDAGVDIKAADDFIAGIIPSVASTYDERVVSGVGGFASLYRCGDRLLAAGTDGVGSKLKLAFELGLHKSIGIDLVAMSVNDILCVGARPLFFMDYLAISRLESSVAKDILHGVTDGCRQAGAALIGGETAEMPEMYQKGEYDLAGFAVGEVYPDKLVDGSKVGEGDTLLGLPSSGFHSNGYSLLRKLVEQDEGKEKLLIPTVIYWQQLQGLLADNLVTGLAHITGGGFLNIARINSNFDYVVENQDYWKNAPYFMKSILDKSALNEPERHRTFNMGVGMVLTTPTPEKVLACLQKSGHTAYRMGTVKKGDGKVIVCGQEL